MGSFYTNVTVVTQDHGPVLDALRELGRTAYVTPVDGRSVVVYDQACEEQDPEELGGLCASLSDRLGAAVFGVLNHDDGVLLLLAANGGEVIDEYDSCPAYFDGVGSELPEGGDAMELAKLAGEGADSAQLDRVLRDSEEYVFASERHQAIVEALGLSTAAVHTGYMYIEQGESPERFELSELTHVE